MTLSIRARLTLWYTAVLSVALAATLAVFYLVHSRNLLARFDEEVTRAAALLTRLLNKELGEGLDLPEAARDALEDIEMPGRSLAIFDGEGRLQAGRGEGLPAAGVAGLRDGGRATTTVETSAGPFRLHQVRHRHEGTTYEIGVAESLVPLEHALAGLRRALLGSALLTLLLAAGGGWWIARGALRPVALMAGQAQRITDRTTGLRLVPPNPKDELGLLAKAFNDLLARLERALSQQRQFMADASHELRTPVSIARTAIEVTLGRPGRPEGEYRDSLGIVADQMRRLTRIVDDMFTLARADAGGLPLDRGPLYLDELVADCLEPARLLAAPKGVHLQWRGPHDLEVSGDEPRLRQVLINLLDNAIRHTPSGGEVGVVLAARPTAVELAVTDGGPGIPEGDREKIFQRFVRLDPSHRDGGGAGLGLPIARTIVEAHGGTLVLARTDASGSTFLVRLPRPESGDS